jgi:thymidine kinase
MAGKLIYYYGSVSSSKTMQLLAIAHNYDEVGWKTITIKPSVDTRSELIETRAQVPPRKADIVIRPEESIFDYKDTINDADVILIDECQFLSPEQIDELRNITTDRDIDIICFGLRTDFTTHLFPASRRLFELADEITEVKTICSVCGKHASFNAKVHVIDNTVCYDREDVVEPGWDNFQARCWKHYINKE